MNSSIELVKKKGVKLCFATLASFILSAVKNQKSEKTFCELPKLHTRKRGMGEKNERKICFKNYDA